MCTDRDSVVSEHVRQALQLVVDARRPLTCSTGINACYRKLPVLLTSWLHNDSFKRKVLHAPNMQFPVIGHPASAQYPLAAKAALTLVAQALTFKYSNLRTLFTSCTTINKNKIGYEMYDSH
jgi:hypothetical protein